MKNIVSCISAKDLLTYAFQSSVYYNSETNIYIISKKFTKLILTLILFFRKHNCNFIFVDEHNLLNYIGINNFNHLITDLNKDLSPKKNWYKQQILKYAIGLYINCDYIIIDADTFPTQINNLVNLSFKTRFFNAETSGIYMPYEETFNTIFKTSGSSKYDFVCEVFPIEIKALKNMISQIELVNNDLWYNVIIKSSRHLIGFSEYQTYGRFCYENHVYNSLTIFPSNRHFGKSQLSIFKTLEKKYNFISFESYDMPDNLTRILYYLLYKPYFFLTKLFKL